MRARHKDVAHQHALDDEYRNPTRVVKAMLNYYEPQASSDCVKWFMDSAHDFGRYERILG